jgi:hypothetical protein
LKGSKAGKVLLAAASLAILFAAARADARANPSLPDPKLTPGDAFPNATVAEICVPGYSHSVRHVPIDLKRRVYREYHRRYQRGVCCEVDHLVPLALGGSNDIRNLWPEPWSEAPQKDDLETALHWAVCDGRMPLAETQKCISQNWYDCRNRCAATAWCGRLLERAARKYRRERHRP